MRGVLQLRSIVEDRGTLGRESVETVVVQDLHDSSGLTCKSCLDPVNPVNVANEGKLVAIVSAEIAEPLVARMRQSQYGAGACVIGEVKAEPAE